jgi:hypothetical protein
MALAAGHGRLGGVSDLDVDIDAWVTVPDACELLGLDANRVRQLINERQVLAVRREGVLRIPALFIQDGKVLKGLPGLLTVMQDNGYDDIETLRWLFTPDDSLPGTPVQALVENRGTEVKRRAQALAL